MSRSLRHKIAITLVTSYIPLVLSIGFLHTDEDFGNSGGNGVDRVLPVTPPTQTSYAGPCLACLIIAGHFVEQEIVLPYFLDSQNSPSQPLQLPSRGISRARSARAPPLSSSNITI